MDVSYIDNKWGTIKIEKFISMFNVQVQLATVEKMNTVVDCTGLLYTSKWPVNANIHNLVLFVFFVGLI